MHLAHDWEVDVHMTFFHNIPNLKWHQHLHTTASKIVFMKITSVIIL